MKRLFLFLTAIILCAATMHARKPLTKHVVMIAIDGWGGEFEESMMQYDTAATIAYIFGLKQPQVWTGRPMTQVFK